MPALAEGVEVSDGGLISGSTTVGPIVGEFGGRLTDAEVGTLTTLVAAVGGAGIQAGARMPGGSSETLELPGSDPQSVAGLADGDDPWSALADAARALLDRMADFPSAAVGLEMAGPDRARLVHRGTDPVLLDLATVSVGATAWRGYYEPAGDWAGVTTGPERVQAVPGWSFDLPIGLDVPAGDDITLHVTASFALIAYGAVVAVQAAYLPDIDPPD